MDEGLPLRVEINALWSRGMSLVVAGKGHDASISLRRFCFISPSPTLTCSSTNFFKHSLEPARIRLVPVSSTPTIIGRHSYLLLKGTYSIFISIHIGIKENFAQDVKSTVSIIRYLQTPHETSPSQEVLLSKKTRS